MDYTLSDDQRALVEGVDALLLRHAGAQLPETFVYYDAALAGELREAGFLDVARMEGFGALDAALVLERIARLPHCVEAATTMLVLPRLGLELDGPIAITSEKLLARPIRFLPVAQHLLIEGNDGAAYVMAIGPDTVEPIETIIGYPYGRLRALPDLAAMQRLDDGAGAVLRQWHQVGFALEGVSAAASAHLHTLEYVRERMVFGRPVGAFQAVQHRLALCLELIQGARWLALKAAFSGDPADAALAATRLQSAIPQLVWDLHQFNGAQSWTLSNPLHFWTFRLRALQSELGGANQSALAAAEALWPRRARA
ncbi:MAG: acyl-CoA dehydrogenase [Sphingomonadales bacterium]|nr:MAG: acyl-CoA dehydrogenase [Sphingomonadales bacterium]